jgi:hypothetical protein
MLATMSEFVIAKGESEDSKAPKIEPLINLDTKAFVMGSGDIIGKSLIEEFFTCSGTLVCNDIPILKRTNSLCPGYFCTHY